MNCLEITEDGKLNLRDYRSIQRAILTVLYDAPKKVYDLVQTIRHSYQEFRFIDEKVVIKALVDLINDKLVAYKYRND